MFRLIYHQYHPAGKFWPKYITFLLVVVTKMLEEVWREHEVSPRGLGVWITLQQSPPQSSWQRIRHGELYLGT